MASPLASGKQSVNLAPGGVRVSKIRRDPPPPVKQVEPVDPDKRDTRTVVLGILTFTLALLIIGIAISNWLGWSPRSYVAHL